MIVAEPIVENLGPKKGMYIVAVTQIIGIISESPREGIRLTHSLTDIENVGRLGPVYRRTDRCVSGAKLWAWKFKGYETTGIPARIAHLEQGDEQAEADIKAVAAAAHHENVNEKGSLQQIETA